MHSRQHGLIFGPVRSGRLGVSLGLDLLGAKICSFDCLYCEVGATRAHTAARKPYVPAHKLLGELAGWLFAPHPRFDVITLGGMGEPTLNAEMGQIINGVRELAPGVPVAVLTNSSLMADPQVRTELALADIVLPSMDSLIPAEFTQINRPLANASLVDMRRGLLDFRRQFSGKIYLEVLLLAGLNDSAENLERLASFTAELAPGRVDVVTMTRPGAYPQALPAPISTLEQFRTVLQAAARSGGRGAPGRTGAATGGAFCDAPGCPGDVPEKTRHFSLPLDNGPVQGLEGLHDRVLGSLARRPQTAAGLSSALRVDTHAVQRILTELFAQGVIISRQLGDETYYSLASGTPPGR